MKQIIDMIWEKSNEENPDSFGSLYTTTILAIIQVAQSLLERGHTEEIEELLKKQWESVIEMYISESRLFIVSLQKVKEQLKNGNMDVDKLIEVMDSFMDLQDEYEF